MKPNNLICTLFSGQHLKKSSLSESSSDMMDLEDGVDTTPGLLGDSRVRLMPFFGSSIEKPPPPPPPVPGPMTPQHPNNCFKQSTNGQNAQQRHNSALAVSIETDV